jgi:signal transduction histidine kinase
MTRRLVLSYLGLALLILVVLEIPLAVLVARHEQDLTAAAVEAQASGLAAVASDVVEHGRHTDLASILAQYQSRTGQEVAIIDPTGHTLASAGQDHDNDAIGSARTMVQAARSGRSVTSFSSDEGRPWASAAVPISADGRPLGAVLLGVQASSTEQRIHDIWIALAALAGAVLVLTGIVGALLARSLSQPLARLESTVSRFGAGNLTVRADTGSGPPQLRSLARQFNHMAARLAALVDAQSRFVADASHQLRSPLTALRLRLENLQTGSTGIPAQEIEAAGNEVQRLSRLVDGLLTLSRSEGVERQRQPVDIASVIEDRCAAWSALADERQIDLQTPPPSKKQPFALLVPGDLDQILDNLLANALDASSEHTHIRVEVVSSHHGHLEVHVIDQGPGLLEEDRHRAFDRFWQGPGAKGGHSGLGLAIVRQLAQRNHATVELHPARPTGLDAVIRVPTTAHENNPGSTPRPHRPHVLTH